MKKILTGLIVALFFLAACNNAGSDSQATADADTTSPQEEVSVSEENNEEEPKK